MEAELLQYSNISTREGVLDLMGRMSQIFEEYDDLVVEETGTVGDIGNIECCAGSELVFWGFPSDREAIQTGHLICDLLFFNEQIKER